MRCAEEKKFLDAYIDGELEAGLMLKVESHLDDCDSCSSLILLKRRMKDEVAALADGIKAPEHLRSRITRIPARRTRRAWLAGAVAAPLAAAAAVMLVLNLGAGPSTGDEPISAVVDDVVSRHTRELPMEIAGSDPAQVASWFRGKVDFPVPARNLQMKNASFKGARLSSVQANQAAHMVYDVDGHRVTLMIFPASKVSVSGGDAKIINGHHVILGRRNGYNVAVIINGDMAYALSSDLPSDRLVSIFTDLSI